MANRWGMCLGLAIAACLAVLFIFPPWRYRVLGWLKNEPCYKGMPASFWRDQFLQFERISEKREWEWESGPSRQTVLSWLHDVFEEKLSPVIGSSEVELPNLRDPEAIPVLIVLLLDEDPDVSIRSDLALSVIGKASVPALVPLLKNNNSEVRLRALCVLNSLGDRAESAIPALREATTHADASFAEEARLTLESLEQ